MIRRQQDEDEIDGLPIDKLEVDWRGEARKQAVNAIERGHLAVRDGDSRPIPVEPSFSRVSRVSKITR